MPAQSSDERLRVLLTNAEERSMLAACRSLKRAGYEVGAASFTALAPTQWSRACRRRPRVIDARRDAAGFVEQLRVELARRPYAALIPGSDSALLAISRGRERLRGLTAIGLPAPAAVERALSRVCLERAAAEAELTPAASIRCADPDEALSASRELGLPVVLKSIDATLPLGAAMPKPTDATLPLGAAMPNSTNATLPLGAAMPGAPKGRVVCTETELLEQAPVFGDGLLVQPVVRGEPISFGGVRAAGRLLGVAASRYLRMWPPSGGSVAFSETIVPPRGLEEKVERLLAILGWEGIFELELIRSNTQGREELVPIDLNPRPYGSMALAAAAGVPLATLWCDWLLERGSPSHPTRARPGCRYRWEDAELRYSAWQLRHAHPRASIEPLRPRRGVTHAHFQRSDPLPLIARGLYLGKRALER
jgi:predicted ATP-grasp superfamily ATP-dependent carboligase